MRRFIALHATEPGFSSPEEVKAWIDKRSDKSSWRVIEIIPDQTVLKLVRDQHNEELRRAYEEGRQAAFEQIKTKLGLS